MATFSFFQFIFAPIWGTLSDRIGRKPVLMIGLVGYMLSHLINGFAGSVAMLFLSRALGGILSSAVLPTAMAIHLGRDRRARAGRGYGRIRRRDGRWRHLWPSIGGSFLTSPAASEPRSSWPPAWSPAHSPGRGVPAESLPASAASPALKRRSRTGCGSWPTLLGRARALLRHRVPDQLRAANLEGIFAYFSLDKFGFGPREMGIIFTVIASFQS